MCAKFQVKIPRFAQRRPSCFLNKSMFLNARQDSAALKNLEDPIPPTPVILITASSLEGKQLLENRIM